MRVRHPKGIQRIEVEDEEKVGDLMKRVGKLLKG